MIIAEAPNPGRRRRAGTSIVLATLLILVTVAIGRADEAWIGLDDPASRVQTTVLENGLTVLLLEDPTTPVVSFQMWVRVGSRDESRYTGVAHLFEHMMFKGSKHIGPDEHANLVLARGGNINAFTSRDVTVYFEDVTEEALPLVIELEAERLANLDISDKTLSSEREVVIEERRLRNEDNPNGRAFEAIAALAWQALPYRWPVVGWASDLKAVNVEECRRFFDTYYSPNNIVVAIVGSFDARSTLELVERAFGKLERVAHIPRNPTAEPPQRGERRSDVYFDVRSPILTVAWHAPPSGHEDSIALDVTSQILSAGRSSRLYGSLVYEAEAALYADTRYWELADAGLFYAFAGVRPDASIDTVERLLFAEIDRLREEGVTEAELAKAKRQLEVMLVDGLGTAHAIASRIGRDTVTFGRIRPLEERLDEIASVTVEDVRRVARRYLDQATRSVVRVVPPPAGWAESSAPLASPGGDAS